MAGFGTAPGWVRRHRAVVASWTALGVVAAALTAYAVTSRGYPVHHADLDDGGIWVTNQAWGTLGRQNRPVAQLDGVVWTGKQGSKEERAGLDVLQNGIAVAAVDRDARTVTPVDTKLAEGLSDDAVTVKDSHVVLGGTTVGVTDPATGKTWLTRIDPGQGMSDLSALSAKAKPVATAGGGAVLTVGTDGTAYVVSSDEQRLTTIRPADGGFAEPGTSRLPKAPDYAGKPVQATAVGHHVVTLDDHGVVLGADRSLSHDLGDDADGAVLQQPSSSAGGVLVADTTGLKEVDLSSGDVRHVAESTGEPAAPVRLGDCVFGAWASGARGTVATKCGSAPAQLGAIPDLGPTPDLEFRINRGQLVLNDLSNGDVWEIHGAQIKKISNWQAFEPRTAPRNKKDKRQTQQAKSVQKPKAKDDKLGVRAGRTTVLHVLDNDSAPQQSVLSVVSVGKPSTKGVQATIAPDRQSILLTADDIAQGKKASFSYTVDDGVKGKAGQDEAKVKLQVKGDGGSARPTLRDHYTPAAYHVAAGASLEIPVTGDWRDKTYGDPVTVQSPKAAGGQVSVTPEGLVRYTAAQSTRGVQKITYQASTGGKATKGKISVDVVGGDKTAPPHAQDDVAEGSQGSWITVRPLDNDVPGADPTDLDAELTLAGDVPPKGGLEVQTDRSTGVVRVRGKAPGTYHLSYSAGFGAAKADTAKIRVDIKPAAQEPEAPVATPDQTAVLGTATRTLDVLANDYDAQGRLLAVTHAEPVGDGDLSVAVIDGRWLRIQASGPDMSPRTQAIRYTVSNGAADADGSVTVTQRPGLRGSDDAPSVVDDEATVRAGDSVSVPVLDNDSTPSGDPVGLVVDQTVKPAGHLQVLGQAPKGASLGNAYVDGTRVRYVAPAQVRGAMDVDVRYVAENTGDVSAERSSGTVHLHVKPLPRKRSDDAPPTPKALEARVVRGDEVTVRLPTVGSDPDGDSVSVTRIDSAPGLGRVLAYGANSITYQAFPTSSGGTDEFTYEVSDPFGATARGTVRVAVVDPGAPQKPVAVDDLVTIDPSRRLTYDVLANDLRTPGTQLHLDTTTKAPPGTTQRQDGIVTVAPGATAPFAHVPYRATTGLDEDTGELAIRYQKGYDNPPQAGVVVAQTEPGRATAKADLLSKVTDIDDSLGDLRIDQVHGPPGSGHAQVGKDGHVVLPVGAATAVWTYRVTDPSGAQSVGSIYVPARPAGTPYLKPGSVLQIDPGSTKTVDIGDYVTDPEGDPVVLTTTDKITAAPSGMLTPGGTTATSVKVTAGRQKGPALLTFEVADRTKITAPDVHLATISLPVQVGPAEPQLNCPSTPLEVPESGDGALVDVAAVCHVWMADPAKARGLQYTATPEKGLDGVSVRPETGGLRLTADRADAGTEGALKVGVKGYDATGRLLVKVVKLPPPTLAPIKAVQAKAGETVSVDLAGYLQTPVPASSRQVVVTYVTPLDGAPRMASVHGSKLTFRTPSTGHGHYHYRVDVGDSGKGSKRPTASGNVEVDVIDVPGAPTGLRTTSDFLSNVVALSWNAPKDNGDDPIQHYEVQADGQTVQQCPATSCRITGLDNGHSYTFRVRAVNSAGPSRSWSNPAKGEPDAYTGPVRALRVTRQRDHRVSLAWSPPAPCDCSKVKKYRISWPGGGITSVGAGTRTYDASVDSNGNPVEFTVVPLNDKGVKTDKGPTSTVEGMGAGKPDTPAQPTFQWSDTADQSGKAVTVSWGPVAANGPTPVTYQVRRTGGAGEKVVCDWTTDTSCRDTVSNDGTVYSYSVRARNAEATSPRETGAGGDPNTHVSGYSSPGTVEAASTPEPVTFTSATPTGKDGQARIVFTPHASHGKTNRVECQPGCGPWTYPTSGAGQQTKTVTGLPDGTASTIQLRACNDSAGGTGAGASCSAWTSQSVTTYGPIGGVSISASTSGKQATRWTAKVDPNGKAVNIVVTLDGKQIFSGHSGTGAWSKSGTNDVGNSHRSDYRITVTDTAGSSRASKSATASATTPAADPQVRVSQGPKHQDAATCWHSSCAYVHVKLTDFKANSDVACTVHASYDGTWPNPTETVHVGGDGSYSGDPGWFYGYPGKQVWVTCNGHDSPKYTWPNN